MDAVYEFECAMEAFQMGRFSWLIEYLKPFVETGVPEAQCMLGTLYQLGCGVERDAKMAETLLLQAAASDFPVAWCNLGTLYCSGDLDLIDRGKAEQCYRRAEALGGPTNGDYLGL